MAVIIHQPTQSLVIQVTDPFLIRDLIPNSKTLTHPEYNVAVKHTLEATKLLRNIDIPTSAPIRHYYDWPGKYKPYAHQIETAEFLTLHKRAFVLSEMGVGKTASVLWAADWMIANGYVHRALVLAPLSTLERVWKQDIFNLLMHRVAVIVHGSREQRLNALNSNADFYILNHEGVNIKEVAAEIRKRKDIDLVVVDEGSMFRNAHTQKYKALKNMLREDMRIWWLTGTPCPNAPTDAWAQVKIINPSNVPTYFGTFKQTTMIQVSPFKWVPKPDAYELVYRIMQPAIRFRKIDCLDLPPVVIEDRQCALTKEQRDVFEQMRMHMIADAKTTEITAVNAADKITKLRQIAAGCVRDTDTERYIPLPYGPRLQTLIECIEQAAAKVIVVVPFKGIIYQLEKDLRSTYSVAVLNGDVSIHQRNQIITAFKTGPDPHVLLCHPRVMSHGLNLTEADTLVFFAPIYSNDEAQQVVERFNRTGQTRKMTVIRIAAHPMEWEIYKILDNKRTMQDNILNLYAMVLRGEYH